MVPAHGNLRDVESHLLRYEQCFDIESKPFDPLTCENRARHVAAEEFESALRIVNLQSDQSLHHEVKHLAGRLAKPGLTYADQRAVERPRADRNLREPILHRV